MKTDYSRTAVSVAFAALLLATQASAAVTGTIDPVSGFLSTSAPIQHSYVKIGSQFVQTAAGTTAYSTTILVNGVSRRYVVLRPNPAPSTPAPLLLMLHPNSTSPENMANLTKVTDFSLTQGFWAVMPEAIGGKWKDDPGNSTNDDVRFISALIDSLSTQGVDASRVYATGFSNGGFMSERLACELPDKIAAFGIDAATLRGTLASSCTPLKPRAKVYFLGTSDNIVPYEGIYSGTANGLWSAADTMKFWVRKQGCGGVLANAVTDRVNDGTTVQQTQYTGCSSGMSLQLYTIYNGGHAWPGSGNNSTGTATQDIDATGLVWRFVSAFRR